MLASTSDGIVTVNMAAAAGQDAFSNNSTVASQLSRTYDSSNPSVTLTTTAANPTNGAFTVLATFSEAVTGVDITDFVISLSGSKSNFTTLSSTGYTILVTPGIEGATTVDMTIAVAQDLAGNSNSSAPQLSRVYDSIQPTIAITTSTGVVNSGSTVGVTFTLSENSTTFTGGDIDVV